MVEHESPLPGDPEYWQGLGDRIVADAAGPLAGYAASCRWYGVISQRAPWLVAAAAVVIVTLLLTLPSPPDSAAYRWIEQSVAPGESVGALISGASMPTVPQLLPAFPPADPEEVR